MGGHNRVCGYDECNEPAQYEIFHEQKDNIPALNSVDSCLDCIPKLLTFASVHTLHVINDEGITEG